MGERFNLDRLGPVYLHALRKKQTGLAFELKYGKGRFVFLMFLGKEEKILRDQLFIFMKRTNSMLKRKVYGSYKKHASFIFLDNDHKKLFMDELGLTYSRNAKRFDFHDFFSRLNHKIPARVVVAKTIQTIRDGGSRLYKKLPTEVLEDAEKTEFVGFIQLPEGMRPREQTLRKLYWFYTADSSDIATLIRELYAENKTVRWRVPES